MNSSHSHKHSNRSQGREIAGLIAIASGSAIAALLATTPLQAQETLPPIPIPAEPVEAAPPPLPPSETLPAIPPPVQLPEPPLSAPNNPATGPSNGIDATLELGASRRSDDLRQVVNLFVNESLTAGGHADAVNLPFLESELSRQRSRSSRSDLEVEQDFIRNLLSRYGEPGDRLLDPAEFEILLNRSRPSVEARQLSNGVAHVTLAELTPATATQLGQALFMTDYSNGVVLDLRGSVGYDPQVVADVARLFLPRSIAPLVVSDDRFGDRTVIDSTLQPIAADKPLVVLVDGQTRKSSTLLAATLAQSSRTAIVGQPTQGSRLRTQFYVLPSGSAVELAIAEWAVAPLTDGPAISAEGGVVPTHFLDESQDWVASAPIYFPTEALPMVPNIFLTDGAIGRFSLGTDLGNPGQSSLGFIDEVPRRTGENIFKPDSDLNLYYLEDYVLFGYRNRSTLRSFFADRIYMTAPEAYTAEGIGIDSTYAEVIRTYGPPGESGYNEINPFPLSSRTSNRADLYFINYDALGISFGFETGSNRVRAIGLYKAGS